jgi:nicotinate-nucleotide adenylyltransferase
MRRLWFGGSFDPIHHGHLITARAVAESAGFDRVVLVPNNQSPLKLIEPHRGTAFDRLQMCQLAVAGDPLFEVDDIELRRDSPSYTVDTVLELASKINERVTWLIGIDSLSHLPRWHRWSELLPLADFLVTGRPGTEIDWSALPPEVANLRSSVVPGPLIEISSTDIRARVKAGRSIRNLVPATVGEYISARSLYR